MNYQTAVTAKDSTLPVTLTQAKEHLRVINGDLDEHIETLIAAATEYCEGVTGRALRVSETLTQKYCQWPCNPIGFNRQPVTSITHVKYYDADNVLTTVTSTNYRLQTSTNAACYLEFDSEYSKPSLYYRDDAVIITYVAGYATIAAVPEMAKHAVKMLVEQWFHGENVGESNEAVDRCLRQLGWGCYR